MELKEKFKMQRCPICEKEQMQGSVCDNCGFDFSCDYERNRTLCSVLPKSAEPISARTENWKRHQNQTITATQGTLVCPKCVGKSFSVLMDEEQFMCMDCGAKIPFTFPKDESVNPSVENATVDALGGPPVINSAPAVADTMLAGMDQSSAQETEEKSSVSVMFNFGKYDLEPVSESEPKKESTNHPATRKKMLWGVIAIGFLFVLMIFAIIIGKYDSDSDFMVKNGVLTKYHG